MTKILYLAAFMVVAGCMCLPVEAAPPAAERNRFQTRTNKSISEEFNTGRLDGSKWTIRNDDSAKKGVKNTSRNIKFVRKSGGSPGYVTLSGLKGTKKGPGISTLRSSQYGWYETRWRVRGHSPNEGGGRGTVWHPAIWGSNRNFGVKRRGDSLGNNTDYLEADLVEYFGIPVFSTTFIAQGPKKQKFFSIRESKAGIYFNSKWKRMGFEYRGDRIQAWEDVGKGWRKKGLPIIWSDKKSSNRASPRVMNKSHRDKIFWIVSNIWLSNPVRTRAVDDTVHMDVDYLRFYPRR